ncbi:MAG: type II toxin-antitoxin system RelE/ParE family toxin [Bryobacterales bacterium]|nr:type II toxin-antitoxin system RelE/ParE family toxin [Bryobacterales bacterium]
MTILFSAAAAEAFSELPESAKRTATRCLDLLAHHPRMYPLRRRGIMRGYRYFVAGRYLFYYRLANEEVQVTALIPGVMRDA